jgi:regulator of replication initiation timing
MNEIEKLLAEIEHLRLENEKLRQEKESSDLARKIIQNNAENIILKSINMAYDIRIQLKKMLESLKGKTYEEGVKIIINFVSDNKHFLGNDLTESKQAVKEFVNQLINDIKN